MSTGFGPVMLGKPWEWEPVWTASRKKLQRAGRSHVGNAELTPARRRSDVVFQDPGTARIVLQHRAPGIGPPDDVTLALVYTVKVAPAG